MEDLPSGFGTKDQGRDTPADQNCDAVEDEERDTLVSQQYPASSGEPPLVLELCVEVPASERTPDAAGRVIEALARSLMDLGWTPTVVCTKRPPAGADRDGYRT